MTKKWSLKRRLLFDFFLLPGLFRKACSGQDFRLINTFSAFSISGLPAQVRVNTGTAADHSSAVIPPFIFFYKGILLQVIKNDSMMK